MRADVTVRGAGVLGLASAWACAARGARVRVADPGGVGAGASGGLVGALSPLPPDRWSDAHALQLRSLLLHDAFWAAVREAGGLDAGFARSGRLMPLADDSAVAQGRARAEEARRRWPAPFAWEVVPAAPGPGRPWGPLSPTGLWARDTLAARLHPRRALAALAAALRTQGAEIVAEAPDEGAVIEATGAAGLLARSLGAPVKGQAALLALPGAAHEPQCYAGGLYVVPHADGTVAVGSTAERAFAHEAPDALLDDVLARARLLVPALAAAPVLERWSGLRPRAADGGLLVGRLAEGGPILANGAFRTGFGMAPLVAGWVADLALEGRDAVPPSARADRLP